MAILESWDLYRQKQTKTRRFEQTIGSLHLDPTLQLLWDRNPRLEVTTDMLKIAQDDAFRTLISKADRVVYNSVDVLGALAEDESPDRLEVLLMHDASVIIPFEVAARRLKRPGCSYRIFLLEHIPKHHRGLHITEELFLQLLPPFPRGYLHRSKMDAYAAYAAWDIGYEQYAEKLAQELSQRKIRFELTPQTRERIEYNFWVASRKPHQELKDQFLKLRLWSI
ncbi:hypothetical protein F4819DRAFT_483796 [Hypoxylon fuscum]|nr:hypothetical protein F4819DRAFT_483796 [Hypoxylon fuscum]